MTDSPSPSPSGIPEPSSSPNLTTAPETPPKKTSARGSRGRSSARAGKSKKNTARKTSRGRGASVKPGETKTPPPRGPEPEPGPEIPKITTEQVRTSLREAGELLNQAACAYAGVYPNEWDIFTFDAEDLDELEGPVTRIVNKNVAAARLVEKSDELVVTLKLGRWALEGVQGTRSAANYAHAARRPEPEEEERPSDTVPAKAIEVPRAGGGGAG
jgi:hypothetical protein